MYRYSSPTYPSTHLPIHPPTYPSIHPFTHSLSTYPFANPSIHPFTYPSTQQSISIHPSLYSYSIPTSQQGAYPSQRTSCSTDTKRLLNDHRLNRKKKRLNSICSAFEGPKAERIGRMSSKIIRDLDEQWKSGNL